MISLPNFSEKQGEYEIYVYFIFDLSYYPGFLRNCQIFKKVFNSWEKKCVASLNTH